MEQLPQRSEKGEVAPALEESSPPAVPASPQVGKAPQVNKVDCIQCQSPSRQPSVGSKTLRTPASDEEPVQPVLTTQKPQAPEVELSTTELCENKTTTNTATNSSKAPSASPSEPDATNPLKGSAEHVESLETVGSITTLDKIKIGWERCQDHWTLEWLGSGMAVMCLVAVITILAIYKDKPISNSTSALSINSWIAIFTAIMKASIMLPVSEGISQAKWLWFTQSRPLEEMAHFDNASRGPWGSALLLFWLIRGRYQLGSFGAFISILAMAIDPFSQQIIRYYSCSSVSTTVYAVTPRTNNYTADGIPTRPGNAELNNAVSTAMLLGALDAPINETALIPLGCPSGNCTFLPFQTIGMCHTCNDRTALIRSNNTFPGYWLENFTPPASWGDRSNWPANRSAYVGRVFPDETTNNPYAMFWSRKTVATRSDLDDLITFDALMLNVDADCDMDDSTDCPKHPWAVQCSIYPCIKTYTSNIINSVLQESVVSTIPLRKTNQTAVEITTSPDLTFSLATDQVLRNGSMAQCQTSDQFSDATKIAVGVNKTLVTGNPDPGQPIRYYEPDCVWTLGYYIGLGLNQYMSWMWDDDTNNYLEAFAENTVDTQGPQQLKMMYQNGTASLASVDSYVARITGTLTAMMRQRGEGGPDNWAFGNVIEPQTCIQVRWEWLAIPASVILFGFGFLVFTAIFSARAGMWRGGWRSSAVIPFLLRKEGDGATMTAGELGHRKSTMENKASKMRVVVDVRHQTLTFA